MTIYFTADLHFGHKFISDLRGFNTVEGMDVAIVHYWNNIVKPQDEVYILGDVSFHKEPTFWLNKLYGKLHLIIGNHDSKKVCTWYRWKSVQHYKELRYNGEKHILSHYPFVTWNGSTKGTYHLHGHCHGGLLSKGRRMDVGLDAGCMHPISIEDVHYKLSKIDYIEPDYHRIGSTL